MSKEDALIHFSLAPLGSRRDMAMLGIIHRANLGEGPSHFRKIFRRAPPSLNPTGREASCRHSRQLVTFRQGQFLDVLSNSILGLTDIYNLLPAFIVSARSVKVFQGRLQELMRSLAQGGDQKWDSIYCPRAPLHNHGLRVLHDWTGSNKRTIQEVEPQVENARVGVTKCVGGWILFAQ